jgi:PEP-CTERM motif-containing protein
LGQEQTLLPFLQKKFMKYIFLVLAAIVFIAPSAQAGLFSYVSNPTSNSTDWGNKVTSFGSTINSNVNFDTHPTGALQSSFYSLSDGVTLNAVGDVNSVTFGVGPGQSNTSSPPTSPGEGLHPRSNYLSDGSSVSNLTISFATPVFGAGLFVIDYFNPSGNSNPLTIAAYTGANATGTLLGSFNSVSYNFQRDRLYFMGVASSAGDIGSIRFIDTTSSTGDSTGIDNILFTSGGQGGVIPEPATMSLLGIGLAGLIARSRKKKI